MGTQPQVHQPGFICDHTPTAGTSPGSPLLPEPGITQPREPLGSQGRGARHEELRLPPTPPWPRSPPRSAPPGAAPRGQRARRGAARCGAVSAGRTGRSRSSPHPSAFPHPCPHPRPRGGGWLYGPPPSRRCHLLIAAFALTRGAALAGSCEHPSAGSQPCTRPQP